MPYDIFISYARKDNINGRVTELKEQIEKQYAKTTGTNLKVFFDTEQIKSMDDFNDRILTALKEAAILVIILSPNYLESDYCNGETIEYLKYEYARGSQNNNVAVIYFNEITDFEDPDFTHKKATWLKDEKNRQRTDLLLWGNKGTKSLNDINKNTDFLELINSIKDRITRKIRIAASPGNLPAPNARFVGRKTEMESIHKSVFNGQHGCITILHGLSGLGKTTLALQYACNFADFYFAGRYKIDCSDENNLAGALKKLEYDLEINFTDDERKNDESAIKKIINKLKKQVEKKAQIEQEKNYPVYPNILLILDNVENKDLINSGYFHLITGKDWLKIIVTTRFGKHDFGNDEKKYTYIPVENLSENEAYSLFKSYCPEILFIIDTNGIFVNKIIKLLDGFTLAIEMSAIYLKEKEGRITFEAFYNLLINEGCTEGIDNLADEVKTKTNHGKLISVALVQMFGILTDQEKFVLNYCCLFPAESIPISWIKELIIKEYPKYGKVVLPGHDDPWLLIIDHLYKLRLLQSISFSEDINIPQLAKMHRLVQEVLYNQLSKKEELTDILFDYVITRSEYLENNWYKKNEQWEINPLVNFTELLLDKFYTQAPQLVLSFGSWLRLIYSNNRYKDILLQAIKLLQKKENYKETDLATLYSNLAAVEKDLGNLIDAKDYLIKAIKIDESHFEPNHPNFAIDYSNLAMVEQALGNLICAKDYLIKAIKIDESNFEPNHPTLAIDYSNLATVEKNLGNLNIAKDYLLKAIKIDECNFKPSHPTLAIDYSNLALVEQDLGNIKEAKEYLLKAIIIDESNFEPKHPTLAILYSNIAIVERDLGNLKEAKDYLIKAIIIDESNFEPNHPNLASLYSNLATVERHLGNLKEAKDYLIKAIKIDELNFEPNHPTLAILYSNLALVEQDLGNLIDAKNLLLKAHKINELNYEPNHPYLAISYSNLARFEQALGNLIDAKDYLLKAIKIDESNYESNHPTLAIRYSNLAMVEKDLGNLTSAKDFLRKAIIIDESNFEPHHPKLAIRYSNLAMVERDLGNLIDAKNYLLKAIKIDESNYEPNHPTLAIDYSNLATVEQDLSNLTDAERLFRKALEINAKSLPKEHPNTKNSYLFLKDLLEQTGRNKEADELRLKAKEHGFDNI
ncbi:MAG: toll/interleukin-1 receptor domain-containing protein [bacterium]